LAFSGHFWVLLAFAQTAESGICVFSPSKAMDNSAESKKIETLKLRALVVAI
jgi:hypothetical protein